MVVGPSSAKPFLVCEGKPPKMTCVTAGRAPTETDAVCQIYVLDHLTQDSSQSLAGTTLLGIRLVCARLKACKFSRTPRPEPRAGAFLRLFFSAATRGPDFRLWHLADITANSEHVRCRG